MRGLVVVVDGASVVDDEVGALSGGDGVVWAPATWTPTTTKRTPSASTASGRRTAATVVEAGLG
jgi:hypothetical protein